MAALRDGKDPFCGKPVDGKRPYCLDHAKRAFDMRTTGVYVAAAGSGRLLMRSGVKVAGLE